MWEREVRVKDTLNITFAGLLHAAARDILLKHVRPTPSSVQNPPMAPTWLRIIARILRVTYKAPHKSIHPTWLSLT